MKPNIYDYATTEYAQDAFIAWLCANYNYPQRKQIAEDFIRFLIGESCPEFDSVSVENQVSDIDILLTLRKGNDIIRYVIIEDKKLSSEHSNQVQNYISKLSGNKITGHPYNAQTTKISVVYYKTGHITRHDSWFMSPSQGKWGKCKSEEDVALMKNALCEGLYEDFKKWCNGRAKEFTKTRKGEDRVGKKRYDSLSSICETDFEKLLQWSEVEPEDATQSSSSACQIWTDDKKRELLITGINKCMSAIGKDEFKKIDAMLVRRSEQYRLKRLKEYCDNNGISYNLIGLREIHQFFWDTELKKLRGTRSEILKSYSENIKKLYDEYSSKEYSSKEYSSKEYSSKEYSSKERDLKGTPATDPVWGRIFDEIIEKTDKKITVGDQEHDLQIDINYYAGHYWEIRMTVDETDTNGVYLYPVMIFKSAEIANNGTFLFHVNNKGMCQLKDGDLKLPGFKSNLTNNVDQILTFTVIPDLQDGKITETVVKAAFTMGYENYKNVIVPAFSEKAAH